jgi:hypothetical protein
MENDHEIKKRGVTSHDRKLAGDVRRMTLQQIRRILETPKVEMSDKDYELYKAVLLSLSRSILPRLTEITGEEGGPLQVQQITGMVIMNDEVSKD